MLYEVITMGAEIDTEKEFAGLERIKPEARKNIIGIQAQIWAETILKGEDDLMYRILPKLMGFAETAWGKERPWETISDKTKREATWDKDWNTFANTLAQKELPRLKSLYRITSYNVCYTKLLRPMSPSQKNLSRCFC